MSTDPSKHDHVPDGRTPVPKIRVGAPSSQCLALEVWEELGKNPEAWKQFHGQIHF